MFTIQWLTQPAFRLLTLTLLHFVWQALAIALLLVVLVELIGIRRSNSRYACSLVALLAMAVAPFATLTFFALSRSTNHSDGVPSFDFTPLDVAATDAPWNAWLETAQPYLLAVWLAGIALLGSRLLIGVAGVCRLRRRLLPLPGPIASVVNRLGRQLKIDALPFVFLSSHVAEAMAVGVIRPLVLIPAAWAAEMPLELLEAVIAHELAHLRRHDLWVNLVQRVVETLLFYHPAVWWLSRRLRIEREMCADELAVAATGKRLQYAQALEQIAGEQQADIRPALAAFLRGETNMCLLKRIRNVLGQPSGESSRMWPVGIVALALPLGLWAALTISGVANADDDRDSDKRPSVKRDRDVERVEIRGGDRETRERSGDREDAVITRVGDQLIITRKLDEPRGKIDERELRKVDRDGRERFEVQVRDRDRGDQGDRRMDELTALVKQLAQRVERLQDEVAQLRGQKAPVKREVGRDEDTIRLKRSADERNELDSRKRELAQAAEKIEAARRELAAKEKALAELAAKDRAEVRARLLKENPDRSKLEPDDEIVDKIKRAAADKIRAAEEKARAAVEKGAAIEREKEAIIREQKDQAHKEVERAIQRKEEAAREKKEAERKELEKKLKELKEGRDSAAIDKIEPSDRD